jgi:hypothetical protein
MSLADEIRARAAGRYGSSSARDGGDGGLLGPSSPFSIFNRVDYAIFLLFFAVVYFVVKREYKVDLLEFLWFHYLRPNYDDGEDSDG